MIQEPVNHSKRLCLCWRIYPVLNPSDKIEFFVLITTGITAESWS
jgi:hypothetical protein